MLYIHRSVQLTVQQEVPLANLGPLRSLDRTGTGRMDLVISSSDYPTLLADVTVTHPSPANPDSLSTSILQPLHFAKHAESRKIRRYQRAAEMMHHRFAPLALETYGAMGPALSSSLKALAIRFHRVLLADPAPDLSARSTLIRYWRVRISACLQRANARLILSKANRINSRSRQGHPPGIPSLLSQWTIS